MDLFTKRAMSVLCALLAFALFSCSDDLTETDTTADPPPAETVDVEVRAQLPGFTGEKTRTTIALDDNGICWTKGDSLGVFYYPAEGGEIANQRFDLRWMNSSMNEGVFTTTADFEWSKDATGHRMYAIYPYNKNNTDLSAIRVKLPSALSPDAATAACENGLFLVGEVDQQTIAGPVHVNMECPLKLLHIVLDASGTLLDGGDILSMDLTAQDAIVGSAVYNVTEKKFTGFDTNTISVEFEDQKKLSRETHLWFYVNPDADFRGTPLQLKLSSDIFEASFSFQARENEEGAIVLDVQEALEVNDGSIEVKGQISPLDANSYMLRPGEHIILPVERAYTVWNGMLGGSGDPIADDAELDCKVMWIDTEGGLGYDNALNAVSMFNPEDGSKAGIFVKAGSRPGNALVALTADGEIRWSWHIWVTDYNPAINSRTIRDMIFMDRNLGAINTIPGDVGSKGYAYQWGRKDPFPCHDPAGAPDPYFTKQFRNWWDAEGELLIPGDLDSGMATGVLFAPVENDGPEISGVAHSLKNPTLFLYGGENGLWTTRMFLYPPQLLNILWDTAGSADMGGKKAMFDPCPAGWRVPNNVNFIFELQDYAGVVPGENIGDLPAVNPYNESNLFFEVGTGADFGPYGYFPALGFMETFGANAGGWREEGENVGSWLSVAGGYGGRNFFVNTIARGLEDHMISSERTSGLAVRCVKE